MKKITVSEKDEAENTSPIINYLINKLGIYIMNKRQILAILNDIANEFDNSNFYSDADKITNVMTRISQNLIEKGIQSIQEKFKQYNPLTSDQYKVRRTTYPGTPQQQANYDSGFTKDGWKYIPLYNPTKEDLNLFIAEEGNSANLKKYGPLIYYNLKNRLIPEEYLKRDTTGYIYPQSQTPDPLDFTNTRRNRYTDERHFYRMTRELKKQPEKGYGPGLNKKYTPTQLWEIFLNRNKNFANYLINHFKSFSLEEFKNNPAYRKKIKLDTKGGSGFPTSAFEPIYIESNKFNQVTTVRFNRQYYVNMVEKYFAEWVSFHDDSKQNSSSLNRDIEDILHPIIIRWVIDNVEKEALNETARLTEELKYIKGQL